MASTMATPAPGLEKEIQMERTPVQSSIDGFPRSRSNDSMDESIIIAEPPSFDGDCSFQEFCTPPRPLCFIDLHAPTSYQAMPAFITTPAAADVSIESGSPEVKKLQLSQCLDEPNSLLLTPTSVRPVHDEVDLQLQVQLIKEQGFTTLGMDIEDAGDSNLRVLEVDEDGLAGYHNARQALDEHKVLSGDIIFCVNGVRDQRDDMLHELKVSERLVLSILRSPQDKSCNTPNSKNVGDIGPAPTPMSLRADACAFIPSSQTDTAAYAHATPPGFEDYERRSLQLADATHSASAFPDALRSSNSILAPYLPATLAPDRLFPAVGTPTAR